MSSLFIQSREYGFEVDTPSFGYWVKAGMAFTLGTGILAAIWALFVLTVLVGFGVLTALPHIH